MSTLLQKRVINDNHSVKLTHKNSYFMNNDFVRTQETQNSTAKARVFKSVFVDDEIFLGEYVFSSDSEANFGLKSSSSSKVECVSV